MELIRGHMCISKRIGLPQGSPLSPLLANIYAQNTIDKVLRSLGTKGFRWFRYADDILILCKDKQSAQIALGRLEKVAQDHHLKVHPKKSVIHNLMTQETYAIDGSRLPDQKLVYLGYDVTVKLHRTIEVEYAISHKAIIRLYDSLRSTWNEDRREGKPPQTEKERLGEIPRALKRSVQVIGGWLAYYGLAREHTPEDRKQAIAAIIHLAGCTPQAMNDLITTITASNCWTDIPDQHMRQLIVIFQIEEALFGNGCSDINKWYLTKDLRMHTKVDEQSEQQLTSYYTQEDLDFCTRNGIRAIMAHIAAVFSIEDMSIERFHDPKTRKYAM